MWGWNVRWWKRCSGRRGKGVVDGDPPAIQMNAPFIYRHCGFFGVWHESRGKLLVFYCQTCACCFMHRPIYVSGAYRRASGRSGRKHYRLSFSIGVSMARQVYNLKFHVYMSGLMCYGRIFGAYKLTLMEYKWQWWVYGVTEQLPVKESRDGHTNENHTSPKWKSQSHGSQLLYALFGINCSFLKGMF